MRHSGRALQMSPFNIKVFLSSLMARLCEDEGSLAIKESLGCDFSMGTEEGDHVIEDASLLI